MDDDDDIDKNDVDDYECYDSCDSSKTDSHEQQKNPRNKIFPSKNPLERIENKQRPKRKPGKGKTRKRELMYCGDQG